MFKKLKENRKGFTLLELLAVLIIMAALSAIAIPIFSNKGEEARLASHKSNLDTLFNAVQRYNLEDDALDASKTEFFGVIDQTHPLLAKAKLAEVPKNPYEKIEGKENYKYVVGIDHTSTESNFKPAVYLAAVGENGSPTNLLVDGKFPRFGTEDGEMTIIDETGKVNAKDYVKMVKVESKEAQKLKVTVESYFASTENPSVYVMAVPTGKVAPTAAQVVTGGTEYTPAGEGAEAVQNVVSFNNEAALTANTKVEIEKDSLTTDTVYDVYVAIKETDTINSRLAKVGAVKVK